jgi:hypothetical protein
MVVNLFLLFQRLLPSGNKFPQTNSSDWTDSKSAWNKLRKFAQKLYNAPNSRFGEGGIYFHLSFSRQLLQIVSYLAREEQQQQPSEIKGQTLKQP